MATYDVTAALAAAASDDAAYFDSTIPGSTGHVPPLVDPSAPRTRARWTGQDPLAGLTADDNGRLARNVIAPPRFANLHEGEFIDPESRCWISSAPDGTTLCLEYRHAAGLPSAAVEWALYLGSGALQAGLSCQVWWAAGFDWGDPAVLGTTGKLGVGLIIGSRNLSVGGIPPERQAGVSIRNTWTNGTPANPNRFGARSKIYSYSLNRKEERLGGGGMEGKPIGPDGSAAVTWPTGRWVNFDVEVVSNPPGQASGLIRQWVDGVLMAEERDAITTLDGSWGVTGVMFSDTWNVGVSPASQSVWLRNIRFWTPPTGGTPGIAGGARPDYPMLRPNGSSPATEVALVVNNAMQGRLNAVFDVAISAGADGATVVDERIHPYSMLIAEPNSSITGHTVAAGVLMLSVNPGPARFERIGIIG